MTFVLGLTGGIATGKSTADGIFKELGIPVVDADRISHQLLAIGHLGWRNIKKHFGSAYLMADQNVDTHKLGNYVFSHPAALHKLEQLNLPLIIAQIHRDLAAYEAQKQKLVVLDAPTLFENQLQNICDAVLVISLPAAVQQQRLQQRDHLTVSEAQARIRSQMPLRQKEHLADYVIANTGTIEALKQQIISLLAKIKEA